MKCDKLKAEQWLDYSGEPMPCYPKATVDAAIDELKREHHRERHEYIEMVAQLKAKLVELESENERLKNENKKMYTKLQHDTIIDAMSRSHQKELRATQRALWMSRAERAVAAQSVHEWCRYNEKHPCGLWRADPFECWVQAWICVEKLCRKKAKEYK